MYCFIKFFCFVKYGICKKNKFFIKKSKLNVAKYNVMTYIHFINKIFTKKEEKEKCQKF